VKLEASRLENVSEYFRPIFDVALFIRPGRGLGFEAWLFNRGVSVDLWWRR
jgi:hypothetical protein